jgi:LPXTG-motif cell wall-anchored protein
MAVLQILWPILLGVALLAVLALVVDRRRRSPGSTDHHDRLTDSARPPEAHRMPGQSDQYNR